MRKRVFMALLTAAGLVFPASLHAASSELILFETPNCGFCKLWLRDVGPGYASSTYGSTLPLRRIDLTKGVASGDRKLLPVKGVPTFVVRYCDREMARFAGFRGKDDFYARLTAAMKDIKGKRC